LFCLAQAATRQYHGWLNGTGCAPSSQTTAFGYFTMEVDDVSGVASFDFAWNGLFFAVDQNTLQGVYLSTPAGNFPDFTFTTGSSTTGLQGAADTTLYTLTTSQLSELVTNGTASWRMYAIPNGATAFQICASVIQRVDKSMTIHAELSPMYVKDADRNNAPPCSGAYAYISGSVGPDGLQLDIPMWNITRLSNSVAAAHIHAGFTGECADSGSPVVFFSVPGSPCNPFCGIPAKSHTLSNSQDYVKLNVGLYYVNVHTAVGVEISASVITSNNPVYSNPGSAMPYAPPTGFKKCSTPCTRYYKAYLNGAAASTSAKGSGGALIQLAPDNPNGLSQLSIDLAWNGMSSIPLAAHLHSQSGVVYTISGVSSNTFGNIITATFNILPKIYTGLILDPSQYYFNIHTTANPGGEIRGNVFASNVRGGNYAAVLTDRQASGSVCSAANITVMATVDESFVVTVPSWSFSKLNKPVQGIHVHGPANQCTGGPVVQAFSTIDTGKTQGIVSQLTTPLTSAQVNSLNAGIWYIAIHAGDSASPLPDPEILGWIIPSGGGPTGGFTTCNTNTCGSTSAASSLTLNLAFLASLLFVSSLFLFQ